MKRSIVSLPGNKRTWQHDGGLSAGRFMHVVLLSFMRQDVQLLHVVPRSQGQSIRSVTQNCQILERTVFGVSCDMSVQSCTG